MQWWSMLKLGDQRGSVVRVARVDILLQPVYVIISLMGLVEFFYSVRTELLYCESFRSKTQISNYLSIANEGYFGNLPWLA